MAAIDIVDVRKSFGDVTVLKGVDLAIQSGEFVVLVGPSGCGKSTLLRLIAGLEELSSGEIRIAGRTVNDLPPKDRDIAMVFQSYALYPHMTVRDNMSYSLRLKRTAADKIAAAVRQAGAKLGLEALQERKPRQLSGGQRQRVAMGRAIVRHPKAFLFDEPLSNLDARLREQMRFEIRKLHRDLGATSVYVTHDQIEAMTMADRIVAMNGGVVQQVGTPLELYDDPANVFVAGFIGSPAMNFLPASLVPTGDEVEVRLGDAVLARLPGTGSAAAGRRDVTLGLRPERLSLVPRGEGLPATVLLVEPTGASTIIHLEAGPHVIKLFTTDRQPLAPGEEVFVRVEAGELRLFDPASGVRIRSQS
jgi:multiple sugar transport system ATP-binding protein